MTLADTPPNRTWQSFHVRGIRIDAVDLRGAIEILARWIAGGSREYVVFQGAHGVVECLRSPRLRRIDNGAGLVAPDGTPGVWLGRYKGHREMSRVYGPDLLLAAVEHGVDRGWRHYFHGGKPGVAEHLVDNLKRRHPGLAVAGIHSPEFGDPEAEDPAAVAARIDTSGAHLVWVGLGCPKQDYWMARYRPYLEASVLLGVGAAFDFLSGEVASAPDWMKRSGLEWLFRLLSEPRRLAPRYLRVVPVYMLCLLREALRGRTSEP